ncbi:MAG TPA: hypothetical protein VHZ96_27570 [Frankiaceae bacterium]|nr:hypothetical protein [Frankiaceae bacterium]
MGARSKVGRSALPRSAGLFVVGFMIGMAAALLSPVRAGRVAR